MLQIAICDDEVVNILKVKELAELFFLHTLCRDKN